MPHTQHTLLCGLVAMPVLEEVSAFSHPCCLLTAAACMPAFCLRRVVGAASAAVWWSCRRAVWTSACLPAAGPWCCEKCALAQLLVYEGHAQVVTGPPSQLLCDRACASFRTVACCRLTSHALNTDKCWDTLPQALQCVFIRSGLAQAGRWLASELPPSCQLLSAWPLPIMPKGQLVHLQAL
jgi:hypothetical protein